MDWVLDCSLASAWVLPDETSARADRFRKHLSADSALWVPALWWYELSNTLTMAQRRNRLTEGDVLDAVELYGRLPLQTDTDLTPATVRRFHSLAQRHGLSAYDAAYVELAQRKRLGLATLDRALIAAARKAGVTIVP